MSDDPNRTDPNLSQRLKDATAKADPWFDRGMRAAAESGATPWIVAGVILAAVIFGVAVA